MRISRFAALLLACALLVLPAVGLAAPRRSPSPSSRTITSPFARWS